MNKYEARRETDLEARAEFERLEAEHGTKTVEVIDNNGETQEITGVDCPKCEEGAMLISPEYESYPPFSKYCTECGDLD